MHKVNNIDINIQNGGDASVNYNKTKMNSKDRSTYTYTDSLQSMDKIQEKLKGYERVDDIDLVEIGTPLRYITWKYNKLRFCIGGLLVAKMPTYCKLTNYKKDIQWNVKKEHQKNSRDKKDIFKTIFYKKCFNLNQKGGDAAAADSEKLQVQETLQSKQINKFYKILDKREKREQWLKDNIYKKKYRQDFF